MQLALTTLRQEHEELQQRFEAARAFNQQSVDFVNSYFSNEQTDLASTSAVPASMLRSDHVGHETLDIHAGKVRSSPCWRQKTLLTELEAFVGPLSQEERDAEDDGARQADSSKPALAKMLEVVGADLAARAERESGEQAGSLKQLAEAFDGAALWETRLAPMRSESVTSDEMRTTMIREAVIELHRQLCTLTEGAMMLYPGGFTAWPFGSSGASSDPFNLVLLVIKREDSLSYSMTLCNTGAGAYQYHPSQDAVPPSVRLRPCVHLEAIDAMRLQDISVCWMLVQIRSKPYSWGLTACTEL